MVSHRQGKGGGHLDRVDPIRLAVPPSCACTTGPQHHRCENGARRTVVCKLVFTGVLCPDRRECLEVEHGQAVVVWVGYLCGDSLGQPREEIGC